MSSISPACFQGVFASLRKSELLSSKEVRVWFSSEYDSNQTFFEYQSNQLRVGVLAKEPDVAHCMLGLLRYHLDNHPQLFELEVTDGSEQTVNYVIKELVELETYHSDSFSLDEMFQHELTSGKIEREFFEVDLWTLQRLQQVHLNK